MNHLSSSFDLHFKLAHLVISMRSPESWRAAEAIDGLEWKENSAGSQILFLNQDEGWFHQ